MAVKKSLGQVTKKLIANNAKDKYVNPNDPSETWDGIPPEPEWMVLLLQQQEEGIENTRKELAKAVKKIKNPVAKTTRTPSKGKSSTQTSQEAQDSREERESETVAINQLKKLEKLAKDSKMIGAATLIEEKLIQKDEDELVKHLKAMDKNLLDLSKSMKKGFADLIKIFKNGAPRIQSRPKVTSPKNPVNEDESENSEIVGKLAIQTKTFDSLGEKIGKTKKNVLNAIKPASEGGMSWSKLLDTVGLVKRGSGGVISNILEKKEEKDKFISAQKKYESTLPEDERRSDAKLHEDFVKQQKDIKELKEKEKEITKYKKQGFSKKQIDKIVGSEFLNRQSELTSNIANRDIRYEEFRNNSNVTNPVSNITSTNPVSNVINNTTHEAELEQSKKQDETINLLKKIEENTRSSSSSNKPTKEKEKGSLFESVTDALGDIASAFGLSKLLGGGKSAPKSTSGKWGGSKMTDAMSGKKSFGDKIKGTVSSLAKRGKGLLNTISESAPIKAAGEIVSDIGKTVTSKAGPIIEGGKSAIDKMTTVAEKGAPIVEKVTKGAGKLTSTLGKAGSAIKGVAGVSLRGLAPAIGAYNVYDKVKEGDYKGAAMEGVVTAASMAGPAGIIGTIAHEGAKAFSDSFGEGGFELIQKLRKEDAISYGLGFTPHVDDWSKIEKLSTEDIKTLIATDEFDGKDLQRLKILESGKLSSVSKPETTNADYISKPNNTDANAVYERSSNVEASKEDIQTSGNKGNTIVSAPTVNNQTIQNQTVRLPTRNNDDTTRKYVSSRFANQ